jgi:hypothetical protein
VTLAAKNLAIVERRFPSKAIRLDMVVFRYADDPQAAHFAVRLAVSLAPLPSLQFDLGRELTPHVRALVQTAKLVRPLVAYRNQILCS